MGRGEGRGGGMERRKRRRGRQDEPGGPSTECSVRRQAADPEQASEGRLEVCADGKEEGLAAGDHSHARSEVPDHVVCPRPHDALICIDGKVLQGKAP